MRAEDGMPGIANVMTFKEARGLKRLQIYGTKMTILSDEFERSRSRGYESFVEQIHGRALNQLERRQLIRNRQPQPPQVDIKIS
jgi:predicted dehydrogenase